MPVFFILTADVTAEELFNMFFGGGFHNQNVYTRRGGRWQRTENHSQNREVCLLSASASSTEMGSQSEIQTYCHKLTDRHIHNIGLNLWLQ
jgi:hypothetical protein